jgi:membrane fusion protein
MASSPTPRSELFRLQAVNAQRNHGFGTIQLARPVSFLVLTLFALLCAAALIAYTMLGSFTRKVQVPGVLIPQHGLTKIYPQQNGILQELRVSEGQAVQRGDVLAIVNIERLGKGAGAASVQSLMAEQIQRRLNSFQEEQAQQERLAAEQTSAIERRIDALQAELLHVQREIQTQHGRINIAEKDLARYENLVAQNYISPVQLTQYQANKLEQQARLQQLERSALGVNRDLNAARDEAKQIPIRLQTQLQNLARNQYSLKQEIADNDSKTQLQILAPQDGVATGILAQVGASVSANVPLLTLVPGGSQLEAQLYVPSQAIGFVQAQQTVLLRYTAYPYQKFGHQTGRVSHVSKAALNATELAATGFSSSTGSGPSQEPLYRVTVKLDSQTIQTYGKAQPLAPGMTVEASIQQEQRKLWEWVLEPLYSISGKV